MTVSSDRRRLLVVAAHPDDEVLGCGGTIARYRDVGDDVRVVFLAEGVTARFDPSQFDTPEVRERSARRNANALRAMAVLGVPPDQVFVEQRPCCRLDQVPQIDLVKQIERHIADFRPTELFTHAAADTNVDHRMAHQAVLTAVRPLNRTYLETVAAFEVLSSTEWNPTVPFPATLFYDIGVGMERKVAALAAYEDEMMPAPHPRSETVLRALAQYRGAQAGVAYAEAFSIIRQVRL